MLLDIFNQFRAALTRPCWHGKKAVGVGERMLFGCCRQDLFVWKCRMMECGERPVFAGM